jgi:hypothetical protein
MCQTRYRIGDVVWVLMIILAYAAPAAAAASTRWASDPYSTARKCEFTLSRKQLITFQMSDGNSRWTAQPHSIIKQDSTAVT